MFFTALGTILLSSCATHPQINDFVAGPDSSKAYNSKAIEYFMSGENYVMQGDYAMAVLEYQDALLFDSSSATIYGAMAKAYINIGKLERGIDVLKKALKIDPGDYELREILAQVYYLSGNNKKAEVEYLKLIKVNAEDLEYESIYNSDKTHVKALEKAAEISLVRQQLDKAAHYYDTLIQAYPETVDYYKYRADIALVKNNLSTAILLFKTLIDLAPGDIEISERYGDLLARSEDTQKAKDYLNKLIVDNPDRQPAYISLTMLFARNDEYDSLIVLTDQAMDRFSDQPYFPIMRANLLSNRKKFDGAAQYLVRALEIDPENIQAQILLANAWEALKKYALSDSLYAQIINDNPEEDVALNNYAYSLAIRGERLDEAMTMVEKALIIDPENSSYLDTKGWLLYLSGNYKEAKIYIEKALALNATNAEVLEHLGDVLMKLNNVKDARNYYRQALEIDSENEGLQKKLSD